MEGLVQGWSSEKRLRWSCHWRWRVSNIDLANVLPRLLCLLTSCIYYVLRNRDKLPPYFSSYYLCSQPASRALTGSYLVLSGYLFLFAGSLYPLRVSSFFSRGPAPPSPLSNAPRRRTGTSHEKRHRLITIITLWDLFFVHSTLYRPN